ncbi:MAG TPA: hypothetical protein VF756_28360 [Thermoanaerobaculia bacterium]
MKRLMVLGLLVLSLLGVGAAVSGPVSADGLVIQQGYSCPWYTIYCRRDRDCDNYCGTPGWGACSNGCCACLG